MSYELFRAEMNTFQTVVVMHTMNHVATVVGLGSREVSFVDLCARICEIGHHFSEVGRVICSLAFGVFSFQFNVFETEILLLVKSDPCSSIYLCSWTVYKV